LEQKRIEELIEKVGCFSVAGKCTKISPNGNGNVNDTFVATLENGDESKKYTLQRINHLVFKNPAELMDNFSRVSRHLQTKPGRHCLRVMPTKIGQFYHQDDQGNYWRLLEYIEGVKCLEVPQNENQAYEAAHTFGQFQADLLDLPGDPLVETIPEFHNTSKRFEAFTDALSKDDLGRASKVYEWIDFAMEREVLCSALGAEKLPVRVVHNDTKLNNVLLDAKTEKGVCAIDLDTVMPGCVLHDFGDLVRTTACPVSEDETDLKKVEFLPLTFKAIVEGYYQATKDFLVDDEIAGLSKAPIVITYELGLRFLTDYLAGDSYFKINYPEHNLNRAKVQFQLVSSMEKNENVMEEMVTRVCRKQERLIANG
jgi:Ser/Thr protein kinase RdoA (MazF antagonist)